MSDESTPTSSRRRLWWIVGAAAAIIVALVVFFSLRDGGDPAAAATPSTSSTQTAPVPTKTAPDPVPSTPAAEPTAPSIDPEPLAPIATAPIGEEIAVPGGLSVGIGGLEQIDGDGTGPGEIDGPAIRFTVDVRNDTAEAVPVESTVVNAYFGTDNVPGIQLSGSGSAPLDGSVAPGGTATGTYVFLIPEGESTVTIEVFTEAGIPAVVFTGAVPAR